MLTVSALVTSDLGRPLPAGYAAVPLNGDGAPGSPLDNGAPSAWPLSLCVVVRTQPGVGTDGSPDPASAGPLLILRDVLDGRVLLGCVSDAAGSVQQWVEIWIQDVDGLANALPTYRDALNNAKLDQRWVQRCAAMEAMGRARTGGLIRTGFENAHPDPLLLDMRALRVTRPIEGGSNGVWVVCKDDALLAGRGLPPYSSSLHRYLYVRELGSESFFVPATRGAPTGDRTISAPEALGVTDTGDGDLVPLNLAGGLMMICAHTPLGFEAYADALTGLDGDESGASGTGSVLSAIVSGTSGPGVKGAMLTLGRSGRLGRLVETFHLKLRLLSDAVNAVRTVVEHSQLPLLNLTAASFGVRLGEVVWGLPSLWTSRAVLRDAGEAAPLQVPGSEITYFVASGMSGPTVYSSGLAGRSFGGQGTLQIRQVKTDNGATVVEGTLRSHERFAVSVSDLVWLRFQVSGVRFDLYGTPEARSGMVSGEMRIRTVPQRLGEKEGARLKSAEGVMLPGVLFETLAMANTPCDLFALGVLAVRTLLVDAKSTLPVALDEIQSLAAQVAAEHDPQVGLGLRIRGILEGAAQAKVGKGVGASRWLENLGPQHLTREPWDPVEALGAVTPELWCDCLAMIVRCMPGAGPDSACRDFGDAPTGAVHRVFDRAVDDLRDLLVRSRGLVVADHGAGEEIRGAVGRFLSGQKAVSGSGKR